MAIVAEGPRGRIYAEPDEVHEKAFEVDKPKWKPDITISGNTQYLGIKPYGIDRFDQLFSDRQLYALNTFSEFVGKIGQKVLNDAIKFGMKNDNISLRENGNGAKAYSEAINVYLGFIVDKCCDYWSTCCSWSNSRQTIRCTFGRQAIPLTWDYAG